MAKIKTIKQLLNFSNKKENECIPSIEIELECKEQIDKLNKKAWCFLNEKMSKPELDNLRIIDNLLDRFYEEGTKLICEGKVLNGERHTTFN